MKLSKRTIPVLIFCIAALSTIILLPSLLNPKSGMQYTIDHAVDYLKNTDEPYALLWCNVMCRRFGITEFSGALERYDQILAQSDDAALLRIFRRIADHNNVLRTEDLEALTADIDKFVVPALYCDQMELPDNYIEMLENAASLGDYQLTHVLLAWIFIQENGCNLSLPDGFIEGTYLATAALIDSDQTVTDKELEAAAFLNLAGQGNLVDSIFVEKVISAQHTDAGWSITGKTTDESNWHPTILALLLLLHIENPANSYPTILDPAPS